ncbi:MAG: beta-glycosidase, partial [Dysgonamonadaceae bacterium]|nr:beta-glycosidase [Dysgonamonadaceae bacterium]
MQTYFSRKLFLLLLLSRCVLFLQAQDRSVPLGASGWKLWLDRIAVWKTDTLIVPPVDISKLAVNPPTGGWENLFAKSVALNSVQTIISDPSCSVDVTVPGTVEEFCWDALSGSGKGLGSSGNYEGVSWWGKDFDVPAEAQGKRIKLYFSGGIRQRAEVFVNRILVGYELAHQEAFEVDITDAVNYGGTNKLAVRITDANGNFSWPDYTGTLWGDYYFPLSHAFGGILGAIELKVVNPAYVSDVFVKNNPALHDIDADIEIKNEGTSSLSGTISVEIVENWKNNAAISNPQTLYTNSVAGTFSVNAGESDTVVLSASVPEALPWEIKDANLYDFVVTLKDAGGNILDKYTQRFGFRFLSVEGYGTDARFYFNGKRIFLLSAISWGFWPTNGMIPTVELARKHIASAQTLGQNMLNFHRCQGNDIVLNLADEMGILYYEEPGGYISSRVKADNPAVAQAKYFDVATQLNSQRLLRMVKQHRNHPSLVYYNMVNEPMWEPDEQAKQDMAAAHLLDPTRFISYGSGFMTPGATQPSKLHALPYDQTQRNVGFVDIHNAGNSPGVYTDVIYNSPQNFYRNDQSKGEIFVWGEEGALASPPQLEMIQENIAQVGYNGWDGADYKDWYNAYVNYFQKKKLTGYYPSMTGLITSLGNIQYYEHGRLIENARIADGADLYVLNGFEDMKFDNFSGSVDVFRNL